MSQPTPTRETFEVVRRGYDPQQVDRRVSSLSRELEATAQRRAELERQVEELRRRVQQQPDPQEQGNRFGGLGARIEQILGLADEEASNLRKQAEEESGEVRTATQQEAGRLRQEAERYAEQRRKDADTEAARILQEAKRRADQLRDESERDAKARRQEAEALFEQNRAKAAQAAADFETTLAQRRDQSEKDFTQKMASYEQQLSAIQER